MKLRVKEICKVQGITIGELAGRMGIKRESLSRTISGNPTLSSLIKISDALDVPLTDIFMDPGNKESLIHCPNCGHSLKIHLKK